MKSVFYPILLISIGLFFSSCRTGYEREDVTQQVEIINNSSSSISIKTRYSSEYSSSVCRYVDVVEQELLPGESVFKQIKFDCSDSWTVKTYVSFWDDDGEEIVEFRAGLKKKICGADGEEEEYGGKGVARFSCDDDGCEYLCVEL